MGDWVRQSTAEPDARPDAQRRDGEMAGGRPTTHPSRGQGMTGMRVGMAVPLAIIDISSPDSLRAAPYVQI
jgi:hypothetical protein